MIEQTNYFIIGTDTGVGKTVLSLLFMRYFYENGMMPFYIKPFQTGCTHPGNHGSDARFVYTHIPYLKDKEPSDSVLYCLNSPKAPLFAARDDGRIIRMSEVLSFIESKKNTHNPLIIEAAGGVMVPVDDTHMMIDIVKAADAHPVIAARASLGTINHSLLTIAALRQAGIPHFTLLFIDRDNTDIRMIHENIEAIKKYSGSDVAGVIGQISDFSKPDRDTMGIIANVVKSVEQTG